MPRWQAVDFRRRRPSSQTLDWVERVAGASVVAWRRMTGGIGSVVHRLTIDYGSYRDVLVLRQYEHADSDTAALVRREVATLRAVHDAGLPAPEPIAADADGRESNGHPALLMTRLPGRLDVTPTDPEGWLRQIAVMAVRIHDAQVAAGPFEARIDAAAFTTNGWRQRTRKLIPTSAGTPVIPASATRPAVWEAAFGILRQQAPEPATCFIHRDFQLFNLLWWRGRAAPASWTGEGPAQVQPTSIPGTAGSIWPSCSGRTGLSGSAWLIKPRLVVPSIPGGTCTRLPHTATSGAGSSRSRLPAAFPSTPRA